MPSKTINNVLKTLIAHLQSLLNLVINPSRREKVYNTILTFARDSPLYFTFLTVQFLLSAFPILLFIAFTTSILLLALSTALLFSLFWIGVALSVLIPTILLTVCFGTILFLWGASSFLIGRWIYGFFVPSESANSERSTSTSTITTTVPRGQEKGRADPVAEKKVGGGEDFEDLKIGDGEGVEVNGEEHPLVNGGGDEVSIS